jgi:hypothetical protein
MTSAHDPVPFAPPDSAEPTPTDSDVQSPRLWRADGWTAEVVKNEDDEGWAVAMTRSGEAEPALVGPWTMGRDKKNPKPLDVSAFHTLVKTASEVLRRHEQQLEAQLHKTVAITLAGRRIQVSLDIVPDEDHPSARLSASDASGALLGEAAVSPEFRLTATSAQAWVEGGYRRPR